MPPQSILQRIIGNQVEILSDPVTVSEESAANAIAKARRRGGAMMRKPGNLLGVVWIGIFRRKGSVRRTIPVSLPGIVSRMLGTGLSGVAGPFLRW